MYTLRAPQMVVPGPTTPVTSFRYKAMGPFKSAQCLSDEQCRALDLEAETLCPPFVRRISIDAADPRTLELTRAILQDESDPSLGFVRGSINVTRKYSSVELIKAELFRLFIRAFFEPAGVELGTVYDDSDACPRCGAGRRQLSPLRLDLSRLPMSADIAQTIAWTEWIVSDSLANLMAAEGFTGFRLAPVEHVGKRRPKQEWHQLFIEGRGGLCVPPTRFAEDYFYEQTDDSFVCRAHHLSGLNLVSEIYVKRANLEPVDFMLTTDRAGRWGGVLAPSHEILVSPRVFWTFRKQNIKRYIAEVAHIVD